jgi:hypothetical protein
MARPGARRSIQAETLSHCELGMKTMTEHDREAGGNANLLAGVVRFWNRFWFSPADPTPLGVIRILCGLMLLYVHLAYCYDLMNFDGPHAWLDLSIINEFRKDAPIAGPRIKWEDAIPNEFGTPEDMEFVKKWGMYPHQVIAHGHPLFSIWFHVTDPTWMWVCHGIMLFIMFLFTIGFCTRVTSVLTWLSILCYIQRHQTSLFGMDTIMNLIVFYLMIGPSGAALSVDRLLTHYWQSMRARREGLALPHFVPRPAPSVSANLALRLLQLHVCIVYVASGLSKLQGPAWWNGTAVWSTMANFEFSPMNYQHYMNALHFLVAHRWLWELVMSGTAIFTLVLEIGFPFFMLLAYVLAYFLGSENAQSRQIRWLTVSSAVLLHLGIAIFMGLVTFSLMMLVAVSSFVPAETWNRLLDRMHLGTPPRFSYIEGKAA